MLAQGTYRVNEWPEVGHVLGQEQVAVVYRIERASEDASLHRHSFRPSPCLSHRERETRLKVKFLLTVIETHKVTQHLPLGKAGWGFWVDYLCFGKLVMPLPQRGTISVAAVVL